VCSSDLYKKVWLDRRLVYDSTQSIVLGEEDGSLNARDYMRFYYGLPNQEPDDRMLATIEFKEGPGTCPAYLDVAYIFFEELPLEHFGNRFPQVSAEISAIPVREAVVTIDFKNERYSVNGVDIRVLEMLSGYSDDYFEEGDIVHGTGWLARRRVGQPVRYWVIRLRRFVTEVIGYDGFTAVYTWNINPGDINSKASIMVGYSDKSVISSPTFFNWYSWQDEEYGVPRGNLSYYSDAWSDHVLELNGPGRHRSAVTHTPYRFVYSLDGSAYRSIETTDPSLIDGVGDITLVLEAIPQFTTEEAFAILERIDFYPVVADSQLPVLSDI
jgi:hypothetical protein